MADPIQTSETPAPEAVPAEAPITDDGFDLIAAAFEQLDQIEAKGEEPAPEEEPVPEDGEPKPEVKVEAKEVDPFADEALKTPEGIQTAKAKLDELRADLNRRNRKIDHFDITLKKKQRAFEGERRSFDEERDRDRATARYIFAQSDLIKTGSANQILEALGNLTGRPGLKVFEEMTQAVLNDGRPLKKSPEVEELKAHIGKLEKLILGRNEREKTEAEEAEVRRRANVVTQRQAEIVQLASDPETFPHLAHYVAQGRGNEIAKYATALKKAARARGEPLDDNNSLITIEREIAELANPAVGTPQTGVTRSPGQDPVQKPGGQQGQRSPQVNGIAPSVTRSHPQVRDMTPDESIEDLKRNPDLVLSLFG